MNNWKTILLISSPRSGSSMVRNKLNGLQHIVALPGDSRIVEFCYRNSKVFHKDVNQFKSAVEAAYAVSMFNMLKKEDWQLFHDFEMDSFTDVVRALGAAYAKAIGKPMTTDTIVVDKSPNSMYYLNFIQKHMTECSIAYLYRDARDVVASLNSKPWSSHNTLYNAKRWNVEQNLMNGNFSVELCYDEFVKNPGPVLTDFLAQIGYKDVNEVSFFIDNDQNNNPRIIETDASIHARNQYKFLSTLSQIDRDQEIIEYYCRDNLKLLGYECFAKNFDHRFYRKRFFLGLENGLNRIIKIILRKEEY